MYDYWVIIIWFLCLLINVHISMARFISLMMYIQMHAYGISLHKVIRTIAKHCKKRIIYGFSCSLYLTSLVNTIIMMRERGERSDGGGRGIGGRGENGLKKISSTPVNPTTRILLFQIDDAGIYFIICQLISF